MVEYVSLDYKPTNKDLIVMYFVEKALDCNSLEKACEYNFYIVEQKGKALSLAIPALSIEVILLIVWLLFRSFIW